VLLACTIFFLKSDLNQKKFDLNQKSDFFDFFKIMIFSNPGFSA